MAPKSPWNKGTPQGTSNNHPSTKTVGTSSSVVSKDPVSAQTNYDEAQKDEFEALSAIYQDDFKVEEAKSAWNKTTERTFALHLHSNEDEDMYLVLFGKLTATYPKTVPLLSIKEYQMPDTLLDTVEVLLRSKPRELLGEVMIYEIATAIVDMLDDAAEAAKRRQQETDALPSLEQERAEKEAEAARQAHQVEIDVEKKRAAGEAEEARGLQELVDREISRRQEDRLRRKRESEPLISPRHGPRETASDVVDFQRPVTMAIEGVTTAFSTVDRVVQIRNGPLTRVFTAQPVTAEAASIDTCLVLKKFRVQNMPNTQRIHEDKVKRALFDLEDELEKLKRIRHDSAINLIEFSIDFDVDAWNLHLLVDYGNKGSLQEMLEMVASVPSDNVRIWTIQLLEALDYYHRNAVVHGRIHPNNVLMSRSLTTGGTTAKLSDATFQNELYNISNLARGRPLGTDNPVSWVPPEFILEKIKTRKTDVFETGIVFVQMLFGLDAIQKYSSPATLINSLDLSEPLEDVLMNFFKEDPKRRHDAFDLLPSEFFRSNAPIFESGLEDQVPSLSSLPTAFDRNNRTRRGSNLGFGNTSSRYTTEWDELGRLGKGGYGEVVKARNKLDGRIYAIKKIVTKTPADLTAILSEVMLLSRLNDAYVVRYYTAWPEEEYAPDIASHEEEEDTTTDTATTSEPSFFMRPTLDSLDFGPSSRGLDFVSASGPQIKFGNDSDSEDADSEAIDSDGDSTTSDNNKCEPNAQQKHIRLRRSSSNIQTVRPNKSTLYIQMEFCERHTLRDLIIKNFFSDFEHGWRLFHQILEGLSHIHGQGIIHRDLKPDNVFIDLGNNPKIGDFGLATSGQYGPLVKSSSNRPVLGDMTRSVGTTLYVAPELSSQGTGSYNEKVDMYSLGIIFFEMCHPLKTTMERDRVIRNIRQPEHELPSDFSMPEKALQGEIILSLINHKPSERPSSVELLRNGKIPVQIEDETIQEALRGLSDPSSPYYQKMMSALFSQPLDGQIKDVTWDMNIGSTQGTIENEPQLETYLLRDDIKMTLARIFRRHGAIEMQRPMLFPLSHHYTNSSTDVVKLLDPSGCIVQLPYDLTLPNARQVAKQMPPVERTFAFGNVYRNKVKGGAPKSLNEADFDIVSREAHDFALKEAEIIKTVDEIIEELPSLTSMRMCYHLNHSDLLETILEFCRIPRRIRPAVKEIVSKLNIHGNTWQKVRAELRTPSIGVSSTSLDDLSRFDFRDAPEKAFKTISTIFEGTGFNEKARASVIHLRNLLTYLKSFRITSRIFICPLSSYNEKFYSGGILFQCLYDNKNRDVLAAGGRYDKLVEQYRVKAHGLPFTVRHAVGVSIGWDRLVSSMAQHYRNAGKKQVTRWSQAKEDDQAEPAVLRRCDVLVAAFDPEVLRSAGVRILAELWGSGISAELAVDARNIEDLQSHYRGNGFNWIVMIKQEITSGVGKPEIKVRNPITRDETDLYTTNLVPYLLSQLQERGRREVMSERDRNKHHVRHGTGGHSESHVERTGSTTRQDRTKVLFSQHRSKKSNKFQIVQAADARANELLVSYSGAPILAVECGEQVMDKMRALKMGDADGWKKLIQNAPLNERKYLAQIQDELLELAARAHAQSSEGAVAIGDSDENASVDAAFVYNFRTGACILFDLAESS